jgi:hypothetical protein
MTGEQSPEVHEEVSLLKAQLNLSHPGSPDKQQLASTRRRTTGAVVDDELMLEHMMREKARKDLVMDICNVMSTMRDKEPQQIIINNMSTSQTKVDNRDAKDGRSSKSSAEVVAETVKIFFASPFNRVCFFAASGASLYLVWGYLHHKWEMEAIQKKIDANFLMRASQWIFNDEKAARALPPSRAFSWI